jgi:hypothetical protein
MEIKVKNALIGGKSMKKIAFVIFILMSISLTGCVKGVADIKINKDGTGDVLYNIAFESSLLSMMSDKDENPLEQLKETAKKEGYSVSQYKDGDYIGVKANKHVGNFSDIFNDSFIKELFGASKKGTIKVDDGFFYDLYKMDTAFNLLTEKDKEKNNWFSDMVLSKTDLKLRLSLPVEALNNNASRIELMEDDKDFRTYVWDIIPTQNNEFLLQAKVWNVGNILLTILLLIGLTGLGIYILRRKQRIHLQEI